jgi:hypothetical protein
MFRRGTLLNLSFLLLLIALPLISFGTMRENTALWGTGLALFFLGFLIPLLLRFVPAQPAAQPDDEPDVGEEPS